MDGEPVVHLHGMLGASDGTVIGGHLFQAEVFPTLELFVAVLSHIDIRKQRSPITGLTEFRAEPETPKAAADKAG